MIKKRICPFYSEVIVSAWLPADGNIYRIVDNNIWSLGTARCLEYKRVVNINGKYLRSES